MNSNRGFTVVELMVVIAVAAIGITLAVPSFRDIIERKAAGGAAEAAYEQLQLAKSQAVKRSKPILVDFNVNGTDWAIGFTDKLAGCNAEDTTGANTCTVDFDNDAGTADNFLMRIQGSDFKNITMSQEVAFANSAALTGGCTGAPAGTACFDFVRGLARTGEYNFDSANYKLRVQVTMLGNINVCIPSGEKKITGYNDC
jgi:type IV fimbrial biogenesis protein FimT